MIYTTKGTNVEKKENLADVSISVIVCTFSLERFGATVNCVHSIFENTYKNYEIILVIDGNEGLKQKMRSKFEGIKNVTVIGDEKDEGPSISRNRGIEHAKGDIIAFIDDDAFATPNWLELIVKNFSENHDILAVGGKSLPIYEEGSKKLPEEILWIVGSTYKGHPEQKQLIRNVFTCNMAVKKSVFKDIEFEVIYGKNGFIKPIKQLEDTLFCIRLNKKKAGSVLYDPDVIVYHNVPRKRLTIGYIFDRTFSEGVLKAKIGNIDDINIGDTDDDVLDSEYDYLNRLLASIIKNFYRFKVRDALLLMFTIFGVASGYISYTLKKRLVNDE